MNIKTVKLEGDFSKRPFIGNVEKSSLTKDILSLVSVSAFIGSLLIYFLS